MADPSPEAAPVLSAHEVDNLSLSRPNIYRLMDAYKRLMLSSEAQTRLLGEAHVEIAALRQSLAAVEAQRDALLADLKEIESVYEKDRVAHVHANQIERIFDRWLHGETP